MFKSFEQDGVRWTFNMEDVYTEHKLWLEDFANIPHHFSLRFSTVGEYMRAKDKLLSGVEDKVTITGGQRLGGYQDVWFSAKTEEDALLWKKKVFDPLFREQAVDFFRKENYMPYNFANAFCHLHPGETIRFHGRIPCWAADIDKVNPLKEPQDWRVKSAEEGKVVLSRRGKEYLIDKSSLFNPEVFKREYVDKAADYSQELNCATHDYFDSSFKAEILPEPKIDSVDCYPDGVIFTLAVAPERFIDVKVSVDNPGLVYVMENEDGSTVCRNDGSFAPGYSYDEEKAIGLIKAIYDRTQTPQNEQFLVWPWEGLSDKQKSVADFLAYESGQAIVYPFAVPYENVTESMVNDIINRCSVWDKGLKDLADELYTVCEQVLGINLELCSLQKNELSKKQSLSGQIHDASVRASDQSRVSNSKVLGPERD